jgi:SET domain-containing protein
MLLVSTRTGPSWISGTGLFAAEYIPKGTVVWRFDPVVDRILSPFQVDNLPMDVKALVLDFCYVNKRSGLYVVSLDNARFMNHSAQPNLAEVESESDDEGMDIAVRDIRAGEELTVDYFAYDADAARKLGSKLSQAS